jgi:hypothetical protein
VHFRIAHEFEIPRDALELAFLSPDLIDALKKLSGMKAVQKAHALRDGVLERVWSCEANVKVPKFAIRYVGPKVSWEQRNTYRLAKHEATWEIAVDIKPSWREYFSAKGTYALVSLGEAKTRRVVEGEVNLRVPVVKKVAERMILAEVRKAFEAEAETLRDMATLV